MPGVTPGLLELKGARAESKYTSLAAIKFIGGLQTQRSPFAGIDTRYGTQFLGGKPDSLITGSNCEISNKLTLQRRPGVVPYSTASIPPPLTYYEWEQVKPFQLTLLVDTASAVYTYSPTAAGIWFDKAAGSVQSAFLGLVNTVYIGDGVDLYKIVGQNLLLQSNTFTNSAWIKSNAAVSGGFADPVGGVAASQVIWGTTGPTAYIYQNVVPNVTPVSDLVAGGNTFTASIWMKRTGGAVSVLLQLSNQSSIIGGGPAVTVPVTTTWTRYQITGTMGSSDTAVRLVLGNPSATNNILIYGAQLEPGGPASLTQITTTKAQGVYNWGIAAPTGTASVTLPPGALTATVGYTYYFAFLNSTTGQVSNVSPPFPAGGTGPLAGITPHIIGPGGSPDPQVDSIALYRNTDGGAFFYQLDIIPNTPSWTYDDVTPDSGLNTQIFAPIGLLNTPPPAGATDPVSHAALVWVHSGSTLFYSTSPVNAAALNIVFNGVSAESFPPLNSIPFDAPITRKISTSAGLLVWTIKDLWLVTGVDPSSPFNPVRILAGHGLRSWNAMDIDGSNIWAYLSDRQFVTVTPGAGSLEVGFPIGDVLEGSFDPTQVYVARHISGSQDNATYLANGSTGWFRVNPNQVGASLSGEQTELWSPFATITGGCGAVASIETSPGVHQLLVGGTSPGPVLTRNIATFTDNGTPYTWSGTIGSIILATAGTLAETESITTEMTGTQCAVAVLLDEISGSFESLSTSVNDPPQLAPSVSLSSVRFYLSQGSAPPICRHIQIQLSGAAIATKDELLSLTVRGALVPEQE